METDLRAGLQEEPLSTVTHARIRAEQGDVRGARAVLRGILDRRPGDREAAALLEEYEGGDCRIRRLRTLLERISRLRSKDHA